MSLALVLLLVLAPESEKVDFGTSPSQRAKLLRHKNPGVRRRAAMLCAHAPADAVIGGLLRAVGDRDAGVREAAAGALAVLRDERAVPFLARRIGRERSSRVLSTLLWALARCGGAYVARHVQPFLEHPSREVRASAAAALGQLGDAGQRAALWAALRYAPDDPDFVMRAAVLEAFAALGWRDDVGRALDELEQAGGLRHWRSRVAMTRAIGTAGLGDRLEWVRAELEHPDARVVAAAAGALADLKRNDDVFSAVGHASPRVRRAALVALQMAGDERALTTARRLVKADKSPEVRFEAALVLSRANAPDADAYLVDALRSRDTVFWITALTELERRHARSFGRDPEKWTEFLRK
ncbi:MAG: HEAT repeat domain-containing protein [Planctomycetota bacterium]